MSVPDDVAMLSKVTGWPVLADPTSGCRHLATAVTPFDSILRVEAFAAAHRPDVIVRVGRPAASRVLATWIATGTATVVQVGGPGVIDPDHGVDVDLPASSIGALASLAAAPTGSSEWTRSWLVAAESAEHAIASVLAAEQTLSEPGVARAVAESIPDGARLVVASSMPVRDLEWFGGPTAAAHANRGANGIDGVLSSALGVALGGTTTVALVGDVAFLHDAGALTALADRRADLRVVVVDNDGGGIFSFLPQATSLPTERFEQLFGTPHGSDIVAVAAAHRIDAATVGSKPELARRLAQPGPSVTRVATDRAANVTIHAELNGAVAQALTEASR